MLTWIRRCVHSGRRYRILAIRCVCATVYILKVLVIEVHTSAMRTTTPAAVPHPELEVFSRILRLYGSLRFRQYALIPALSLLHILSHRRPGRHPAGQPLPSPPTRQPTRPPTGPTRPDTPLRASHAHMAYTTTLHASTNAAGSPIYPLSLATRRALATVPSLTDRYSLAVSAVYISPVSAIASIIHSVKQSVHTFASGYSRRSRA